MSSLAKTTSLASSTGKATAFAVLVDRVDDPVDARIVSDLLMRRINHDDFIILHGGILIHPVRVEDAQVGVTASRLFFRDALQVAFKL